MNDLMVLSPLKPNALVKEYIPFIVLFPTDVSTMLQP